MLAIVQAMRLLVFDRTCIRGAGDGRPLPLTPVWRAGARLYRALGRIDATLAASSWSEALEWLIAVEPARAIAEIQFWGHGHWGCALCGAEALDRGALAPTHPHHERLRALRERLRPDGAALWWFRTCETLGARRGHDFARAWTDFFASRVGGHTYVIGFHQSGLHSLAPGEEPRWAVDEGLARGTADEPVAALPSRRSAPNTITCLHGRIPEGY
jgi:hypothetical protein